MSFSEKCIFFFQAVDLRSSEISGPPTVEVGKYHLNTKMIDFYRSKTETFLTSEECFSIRPVMIPTKQP